MPLLKPKDGEKKKDFISRCMGNDTMNSEYPDKEQRAAVCHSQFEKAKASDEEDGENEQQEGMNEAIDTIVDKDK